MTDERQALREALNAAERHDGTHTCSSEKVHRDLRALRAALALAQVPAPEGTRLVLMSEEVGLREAAYEAVAWSVIEVSPGAYRCRGCDADVTDVNAPHGDDCVFDALRAALAPLGVAQARPPDVRQAGLRAEDIDREIEAIKACPHCGGESERDRGRIEALHWVRAALALAQDPAPSDPVEDWFDSDMAEAADERQAGLRPCREDEAYAAGRLAGYEEGLALAQDPARRPHNHALDGHHWQDCPGCDALTQDPAQTWQEANAALGRRDAMDVADNLDELLAMYDLPAKEPCLMPPVVVNAIPSLIAVLRALAAGPAALPLPAQEERTCPDCGFTASRIGEFHITAQEARGVGPSSDHLVLQAQEERPDIDKERLARARVAADPELRGLTFDDLRPLVRERFRKDAERIAAEYRALGVEAHDQEPSTDPFASEAHRQRMFPGPEAGPEGEP